MRAVVVREFGGPEVLRDEEVETPSPGPGEVLVGVHSVSVNRTLDLAVRAGTYSRPAVLPLVLGVDPAGVIVSVGDGVDPARVGERVACTSGGGCGQCPLCLAGQDGDCTRGNLSLGLSRWGGYAEYVTLPARNAFRIPDSLGFAEATVIVRHAPTAWHLLTSKARLEAGEWLLVMGAAGALGSFGVQIGRLLGARVIAAAGADERVAAAVSYGALHGVNYRQQDLTEEVLRITDGYGVDVVFENISDPVLWPRAFASLAERGRLVTAGAHGGGQVMLDARRLYLKRLQVIGSPGANRSDVESALAAAEQGQLQAAIGCRLPLSQAAHAHQLLEQNAVLGKIILEPGPR